MSIFKICIAVAVFLVAADLLLICLADVLSLNPFVVVVISAAVIALLELMRFAQWIPVLFHTLRFIAVVLKAFAVLVSRFLLALGRVICLAPFSAVCVLTLLHMIQNIDENEAGIYTPFFGNSTDVVPVSPHQEEYVASIEVTVALWLERVFGIALPVVPMFARAEELAHPDSSGCPGVDQPVQQVDVGAVGALGSIGTGGPTDGPHQGWMPTKTFLTWIYVFLEECVAKSRIVAVVARIYRTSVQLVSAFGSVSQVVGATVVLTMILALILVILHLTSQPGGLLPRLSDLSFLRHQMTRLLYVTNQVSEDPREARLAFRATDFHLSRANDSVPHPNEAAARNSSESFARSLAASLGRSLYVIQPGPNNQARGLSGPRVYYEMKDLLTEPSNPYASLRDLRLLVDVDHHMDMWAQLLDPALHLLYAVSPVRVASPVSDSSEAAYTFTEEGEFHVVLNGGSEYRHKLWNYSLDVLTVWSPCSLTVTSYLSERRRVDDLHELVLLIPIAHHVGIPALLARFLQAKPLSRLDPRVKSDKGTWLRMRVLSSSEHYASVGKPGEFISSNVPVALDNAVAISARNGMSRLTLPTVEALAMDAGCHLPKSALLSLYDYHKNCSAQSELCVFPVELAVRRYQYDIANYQPDAKQSLVAFMSPLVHGAFSPDMTSANERICIIHRVLKPATDPAPAAFIESAMMAFVELLIPSPHSVLLASIDEVYERQSRPTQRQSLDSHEFIGVAGILEEFIKKEAYAKVKRPRPITTMDGGLKLAYARIIYAFSDLLRNKSWYAFAKKPITIANSIARMHDGAKLSNCSDFTTLDGSINWMARRLERLALLRAFHPDYHEQVIRLHDANIFNKVRGRHWTYWQDLQRPSGSMETADFNTLWNKFVCFLAWTHVRENGSFIPFEAAYAKPGMYGGDDGVTPDLPADALCWAATKTGMTIKTQVFKRGELGVNFLSRFYGPEVWHGDRNSMSDFLRQISKFHVTVNSPGVSPTEKLTQKAQSFILTDASTPVIGELCRRVIWLAPPKILTSRSLQRWWDQYDAADQWPNEPAEWMFDHIQTSAPGFDYPRFQRWLSSTHSIECLLHPPLMMDPMPATPDFDAVVDAETITVGNPGLSLEAPPPKQQEETKKKKERSAPSRRAPHRSSEPPQSAANSGSDPAQTTPKRNRGRGQNRRPSRNLGRRPALAEKLKKSALIEAPSASPATAGNK